MKAHAINVPSSGLLVTWAFTFLNPLIKGVIIMSSQVTIRTIIKDGNGNVLHDNLVYVDVLSQVTYKSGTVKTTPPSAEEVVAKRAAAIAKRAAVKNGNGDLEARNKQIMKMYGQGKTRREIATKMDLNYQTVYGIIKRLNTEE